MVQKESSLERDIEDTRAVMTEKIDMIENRVNETMEGTKATIDNVMEKVKGVQVTIDTAKSTIDNILDTIKHTMEETIERVKYTSTVIEQVDQSPWIMLGSAVLTGYVLGGLGEGEPNGAKSTHQDYISNKKGNAMETIEKSNEA
jgi:phage-related protein